MAIKLEIENYCERCGEFEPELDKYCFSYVLPSRDEYNTVISCKHKNRCAVMARALENEIRKEIEYGND